MLISLILFVTPIVSGIALLFNSHGNLLLKGSFLVIATFIFYIVIFSLVEKILILSNKNTYKLSYIMPILYFLSVIASITISWRYINLVDVGNIWVFLFAFSACYFPYNYMLQAEEKHSFTGANIFTNVVNNFSIMGYLVFGIIMNFTDFGYIWSYSILTTIGFILFYNLPKRIREEAGVEEYIANDTNFAPKPILPLKTPPKRTLTNAVLEIGVSNYKLAYAKYNIDPKKFPLIKSLPPELIVQLTDDISEKYPKKHIDDILVILEKELNNKNNI